MKTPIFFLVALVAFLVLPLDFTAMTSALFVAGLVAIAADDYRRRYRPIGRSSTLVGIGPYEHFRLAA